MGIRQSTGGAASWPARWPVWPWPTALWRVFQLLTLAALGWAVWRLLGHAPYRIDADVYRLGGQAWLDGRPLYVDGATFRTRGGLELPFTYPPLAAIAFAPFALLALTAATAALTLTTLVLLTVSIVIVLTRLDVWPTSAIAPGPAWRRRCWLATAMTVAASVYFEPIRSNFDFGQVNVVLMTLVVADCVPRQTRWPRGILLSIAIALKLTPAVFLLYFVLRRDRRTLLTATASVTAATLVGFVLAWTDSWQYWTATVAHTDRIGTATLNTNQNIAGALARLGLSAGVRFVFWTALCFAVLAVTVWAARRALRAGEPVLALICVALFGLVVSPVSWSHHWVWALPAVLVTGALAYRQRQPVMALVTVTGMALMVWTPITLLPEHRESTASWWRQLAGGSYVWWALAVIVVAGALSTRPPASRLPPPVVATPVSAAG
jgi:alpha-1,2-mannosyltransferase